MTPENYNPNTNESGDSYQSSHPYGVPEGQRPGPYQQYEQRQKDINKAQAETLLRLARALNCNVDRKSTRLNSSHT